jgi:putative ABC transport system permease protein
MKTVWLILERCALRHWKLAWRQQIALLLILALGSGVYLAMRLANRAALSGFEQFTDGITRQPDWSVTGLTGPLRDSELREMRDLLGSRPVHLLPMIEETVSPVSTLQGEIGSMATWRLIGADWVGLMNVRGETPLQIQEEQEHHKRPSPQEGVVVSTRLASRLGLSEGAVLRVIIDERVVPLKIARLMPEIPGVPSLPEHMLLMDLPEAQKVMLREGEVDRVEVLCSEGPAFPNLSTEVGALLRERWQVSGPEERRMLAGTMTEAFRLNLTILSLLALFVGGYLIFQALDGIVLRRREEIGILKSLGVTDGAIQRAFLLEATLLGIIGGGMGLLIGWAGAQGAVGAVSKTVNALYGATSAQGAQLYLGEALLCLGISVATSVLAAWWPAREAARTPPVHMLGRKTATYGGGKWWGTAWLGWGLMALAVALAQLPPLRIEGGTRLPLGGYASAIAWLLGAGLAAGGLLHHVSRFTFSAPVRRLAISHLRRPTVRHRFAVAALASAIAMTSGMAIMVSSFELTVRDWIQRTMKSDVYVASAGSQSAGSTNHISAATVQAISQMPEVQEIAALQARPIQLHGAPTTVLGVNGSYTTRHGIYAWIQKPKEEHWWMRSTGDDVTPAVMNESFSDRFAVKVGDSIILPGNHHVKLVGIHADYGNERGSITVAASEFRAWFATEQAWRVAMMLKPGADAEAFCERLRQAQPGLNVFSNTHLRSEALRIFRQTFAVTHALEVVGVAVAVAGLGLALACLLLERRADLATLRAIGMTPKQIAGAAAWEGIGVSTAGTVMGIGAGLWLGWLLIYRVNKQCFGWTLGFNLPWWQLAVLTAAVIGAGTLVASMVGRWGSRMRWEQEE